MRIRCLEMSMEEITEHFDFNIRQEWLDRVDAAYKPHYIWMFRGGEAYCDSCGNRFTTEELEKTTHLSCNTCPFCHEKFITRRAWVGQNPARRNVLSYHFAKSIIDPSIITCTVVYSVYGYEAGDAPWEVKPFRTIDGLYVFVPQKGVAYAAPGRMSPSSIRYKDGCYYYKFSNRSIYGSINGHIWKSRCYFNVRNNVYAYGSTPYTAVYVYDDEDSLYYASEKTYLSYVLSAYRNAYKEIKNESLYDLPLIVMLERLTRYPDSLEKISKMGLSTIVLKHIFLLGTETSLNAIFNLRGKDVKAIFYGPVSKADKKYMFEKHITPREIFIWRKLRSMKQALSMASVHVLSEEWKNVYLPHVFDVMNRAKINAIKMEHYLKKQKSKYNLDAPYTTYADYIQDCITLTDECGMGNRYNLGDKNILFPQNLYQAHQETIELIDTERVGREMRNACLRDARNAKKIELLESKYAKLRPKIEEKYSYSDGIYTIVIPPNIKDLTREGVEMHNCVGGYKSRVAEGKTYVVYIRKIESIERVFGTMEISTEESIIQARAKYNKDLPEDAEAFVQKFEHEVLEPLRTIATSLDGVS